MLVDVPMMGTEYMHRADRIRASGTTYILVNRRERPMAAALYFAILRGERVAGITVQKAREQYPHGLVLPLPGADAQAAKHARKYGVA